MTVSDRLNRATERLNTYYEAEIRVLSGQAYRMGNKSMTRADLGEIRAAIATLENHVAELEAQAAGKGRRKVIGVIPRDI